MKNKKKTKVIHRVIHRVKKKEKKQKKKERKNIYIYIYISKRKKRLKMTCYHPIIAWQRNIYPIHPTETELKKLNKISFKFIKGWNKITLPCNKCIGCRLDHANEWATRIMQETKIWKNCCFVTLTYNDHGYRKNGERNLPISSSGVATLCPKDVQGFLKRLRKAHQGVESWQNPKTGKIEKPIRYFYCGEYGTKKRPHYHIAIFNWKPDDLKFYKNSPGSGKRLYTSKKLEKLWGYGFAPIGDLTYESACYIARYCLKKTYKYKKDEYVDEIQPDMTIKRKYIKDPNQPLPEYIQMSRMPGIGITSWINEKLKIIANNGIMIYQNGIKIKKIPRYFKKLWDKENPDELDKYKYDQKQKIEQQMLEKSKQININVLWDDPEFKLDQQNLIDEKSKKIKILQLKRNL